MNGAIERPGITLARGVGRLMSELGFSTLTEFPVRTGRRMDLCALGPRGEIWCIEVKFSRADFQADAKWPDYLEWCDRLYFAVPLGFPDEILPVEHGLIRTDSWGGEVLRDAPDLGMAAARRKAITLRFARLAGERLARAAQPAVGAQP